jgi:hypothetical protein
VLTTSDKGGGEGCSNFSRRKGRGSLLKTREKEIFEKNSVKGSILTTFGGIKAPNQLKKRLRKLF